MFQLNNFWCNKELFFAFAVIISIFQLGLTVLTQEPKIHEIDKFQTYK